MRLRTGGPQVEIVGHGFDDQTLALLRERPEVASVAFHNSHLTIELRGESKVGPLVSLIVRSGGEVEEVRKGKASLEDVFLTLTNVVSSLTYPQFLLITMAVLAVLDAILLGLSLVSFRRSRLILS